MKLIALSSPMIGSSYDFKNSSFSGSASTNLEVRGSSAFLSIILLKQFFSKL